MKKDFEGVLICSDYDGTIRWKGVPEQNVEAINRFMERGGLFTLATGRASYEFAESDLPFRPNAPLICSIGSKIYDFKAQKSLADFPMDASLRDVIEKAIRSIPILDSVSIYDKERAHTFRSTSEEEIRKGLSHFGDQTYKVVFWLKEDFSPSLFEEIKAICGHRCHLCSNWSSILEITAKNVHKGTAVMELKRILGAKTLVCVGDFNGDIPMLQAADISYAVANASDEVKRVADHVTVHAKDGALAAVMEDLERMLMPKEDLHAR